MKATALLPVVFWALACGGGASSEPPPQTPPPPAEAPVSEPASPPAVQERAEAVAPESSVTPPPAPEAKLTFPPHASVDDAVKAVPQGAPRLNMSTDALQGPLQDMKQYEKCHVPHSTKVAISVAVYDGAAVGVDVATKPNNAKIQSCLDEVLRGIKWDKVPSVNQVNINF